MVPQRPFFMGSPGCVRSSAWIELFSSKLNTAAFSGGSRCRPTTSRSFSSKSGSLLSLKVRDRCGFRPRARHVRFTKSRDAPVSRAIDRHDHRVASFGSRVVVASTIRLRSAARSASLRPPWLPPRARSFSIPARPSSAYRRRQRPTLFTSAPSSAAISLFVIPSDAFSTIRDRSRSRTGTERDDDHRSSFSRSPSGISILGAARMPLLQTLPAAY